jgi:hypothetical protein
MSNKFRGGKNCPNPITHPNHPCINHPNPPILNGLNWVNPFQWA